MVTITVQFIGATWHMNKPIICYRCGQPVTLTRRDYIPLRGPNHPGQTYVLCNDCKAGKPVSDLE